MRACNSASMNVIQKKLILVGDGGVGKSNFCKCGMGQPFDKRYIPTLGVEVHPIKHGNNNQITYNAWDTAGQEKFGGLRDGYYIQGDICIVMCDIRNKASINAVDTWIRDVRRVCENIKIIIVANKIDLVTSEADTAEWNARKAGWNNSRLPTFEISCKTQQGIQQVMDYLASIV
jgi:GTP-binding nuclear protein Ran